MLERFWKYLGRKMGNFASQGDSASDSFLDMWGTRKKPTSNDLIRQYQGLAYACANINATTFASIPFHLYVQTNKGQPKAKCATRPVSKEQMRWMRSQKHLVHRLNKAVVVEEVEEHPLLDLFDRVNMILDGFDLFELVDLYQEIVGSSFWYMKSDNSGGLMSGLPSAIWVLQSQMVTVLSSKAEMISGFKYGQGPTATVFKPEEIVHFKFPSLRDPYREGQSPAGAGWAAINLLSKHYSYIDAQMDNRARPDAIVTPKEPIGIAEVSRLEKRINKKFRKGGAGGILVTEDAVDIEPLGFKPRDMEMLAFHNVSMEEVANIFGVPIPFLTRRTNLANLQAARELHARNTIWPRCVRFDQKITQQILPKYDPSGRLFFVHDNPVPEDVAAKVLIQGADLKDSVRSINEVRSERDLPPVAWGEEPWMPSTLIQYGSEPQIPLPPEQPVKQILVTTELIDDYHDYEVKHTRRLPSGDRFVEALRRVFNEQELHVLKAFNTKGAKDEGPDLITKIDLSNWDSTMQKRVAPVYSLYADEGGSGLFSRVGVTSDIAVWSVQTPEVKEAIENASLRLSTATNATTSMQVNDAIAKLRRELAEGIIDGGNTVQELTKRVKGVFNNAKTYRAKRIATTEASRAVHQGQWLAARKSGVVSGFKWLLSSDACEICQDIEASYPDGIDLNGKFGSSSYGNIQFPPAHPNCKCTITEVLYEDKAGPVTEAEYGTPDNPYKTMEEVVETVSDSEEEALITWFEEWGSVRKYQLGKLDKGSSLWKEGKEAEQGLNSLLARSPKYKGEVWRGMSDIDMDKAAEAFKKGQTFNYKTFSSWSKDHSQASEFTKHHPGTANVVMHIKNSKNGYSLQELADSVSGSTMGGSYAGEQEVMMVKKLKLRIDKVVKHKNEIEPGVFTMDYFIDVTEIGI